MNYELEAKPRRSLISALIISSATVWTFTLMSSVNALL